MSLAVVAFTDSSEDVLRQEAISRFCQGVTDTEAGKHACFRSPKSMEEALNLVKQHQYISKAMDGKKSRRSREEVAVNAVSSPSEARVEEMIAAALQKMSKLQSRHSSPPTRSFSKYKGKKSPTRSPPTSPGKKATKYSVECFFCKTKGHMKKDCQKYQKWLQNKKSKDTSTEDLN